MYVYVVVEHCFTSRRQEVSLPLHVLASCVNTACPTQKQFKTKETTFSLHREGTPEHPNHFYVYCFYYYYYISVLVVYKFCIYSKHEGTTVKLA